MSRLRVFHDYTIAAQPVGRVIFELFADSAPKSSENFRALCTGEKGLNSSGIPMYYKNSIIHRSIPDFMIQGGDFTKRNGTGGESIYGGTFPDDDLTRPLDSAGLLCMANKGPDTNSSQFFITLRACPHLDGKHVVFGRVLRGQEVIEKIATVSTDGSDRPTVPILVANCGQLELRKQPQEPERAASREKEKSRKKKSKRRKHPEEDADEDRAKRRKSTKEQGSPVAAEANQPLKETEEEYDARLEREEKERIEAVRRSELARLKQVDTARAESGGIRYKGRGRMKYVDPERTR